MLLYYIVIKQRFKAKLSAISENATKKFNAGKEDKETTKAGEKKNAASTIGHIPPHEEIKSFYGFDYQYNTETDDENKYVTPKNKRFYKLNAKEREAHIINLWRSCQN